MLQKGDVLEHVEKNKLKPGQRQSSPSPKKQEPASTPKQETKPKKQAAKSPAKDPNNPFVQTWVDEQVSQSRAAEANAMFTSKRYVAHTYLSCKCDITPV